MYSLQLVLASSRPPLTLQRRCLRRANSLAAPSSLSLVTMGIALYAQRVGSHRKPISRVLPSPSTTMVSKNPNAIIGLELALLEFDRRAAANIPIGRYSAFRLPTSAYSASSMMRSVLTTATSSQGGYAPWYWYASSGGPMCRSFQRKLLKHLGRSLQHDCPLG